MPSLLLERFPGDARMQHRVEVDVHQVVKILEIAAGHRIHGFIGEGHGVQKGLQTAFHELHERFLDGIFAGPAQHTVLQNMRHSPVVGGRGAKGDAEHLVVIVIFQHDQFRAGFLMFELEGQRIDFRQFFLMRQPETMIDLIDFKTHLSSFPYI